MTTAVINVEKMISLRERKATEVADLEAQLHTAKAELAVYDKLLSAGGLPQKGTRALQATKPAANAVAGGRRPKTAVKQIVLDIVRAAGADGINVDGVVAKAKAQGKNLPVESVAVFLRRAKGEGLLDYEMDGQRYSIKGG